MELNERGNLRCYCQNDRFILAEEFLPTGAHGDFEVPVPQRLWCCGCGAMYERHGEQWRRMEFSPRDGFVEVPE